MNPRYYEFDLTNKCELLNQMHITTHVLSITDCLVQLCLDLLLNSERSHVVPEQLIQWHCRIYNCFQICKIDEVLKAEIFFGREDYVEAQAVYRQLLEKDEKVCILPCPSPSFAYSRTVGRNRYDNITFLFQQYALFAFIYNIGRWFGKLTLLPHV